MVHNKHCYYISLKLINVLCARHNVQCWIISEAKEVSLNLPKDLYSFTPALFIIT